MKSLSFRILVLALLSLCLAAPSFAAGKAKSKPAKKTKAATEVPFDDKVDKLPAKYHGNNLITIFSALSKNEAKYVKSEFETNDAFQERLRKLDDTVLTGKLKYSSPVAIPVLTSFESSYDADNKTMTVSIPMTYVQDSELDGYAVEVFTVARPVPWTQDKSHAAILS